MATLAGSAEIPVSVVLGDGRSHELKIRRQTTWQEFRKRVREERGREEGKRRKEKGSYRQLAMARARTEAGVKCGP